VSGAALCCVLAGHFIGDWVVQTDWQAANKVWDGSRSGGSAWVTSCRALLNHLTGYHLTLGIAALLVMPFGWRFLALFVVSWFTHAVIDRRWTVRWLMRHTGSAAFAETTWGVMAVDQALHLAILCSLTAALT
jgi:hypothetical protein